MNNLKHIKINLDTDREYIFECHCRVNYECDTPCARKIPYEEYRANWFNNSDLLGMDSDYQKSIIIINPPQSFK